MVVPGMGAFEPTLTQVRDWADAQGIGDEVRAELDLRLSHTVGLIAASDLGMELCFKGGTAINKLYFEDTARLSVDLDYNAVGEERSVYRRCRERRESLTALISQAGAELHRYKFGVVGDHLLFRYRSVTTGRSGSFKVEISLTERFAVFGAVRRPFLVPLTTAPGSRREVAVNTTTLPELIGTKIRALHQRRKGRDIFDLWRAIPVIQDTTILRKLVLFYFACRNVPFDRQAFFGTLDQKIGDPRFQDDLTPYLRPGTRFDWATSTAEVRQWLDSTLNLDEIDEEFSLLVKYLVGAASGRRAAVADRVHYPVRFLFGDRPDTSDEANELTTSDLRRLMFGIAPEPDAAI